MKLVLEYPYPHYKRWVIIEQRTEFSKYILSYKGNVVYDEDDGQVKKIDGVMGKFDTIEDVLYFMENVERQFPWFIDKVKEEFNIQ